MWVHSLLYNAALDPQDRHIDSGIPQGNSGQPMAAMDLESRQLGKEFQGSLETEA